MFASRRVAWDERARPLQLINVVSDREGEAIVDAPEAATRQRFNFRVSGWAVADKADLLDMRELVLAADVNQNDVAVFHVVTPFFAPVLLRVAGREDPSHNHIALGPIWRVYNERVSAVGRDGFKRISKPSKGRWRAWFSYPSRFSRLENGQNDFGMGVDRRKTKGRAVRPALLLGVEGAECFIRFP